MANDRNTAAMEKVVLEYPLNSTSVPMIWNAIATAPGLESWFADSVTMNGKTFVFSWGQHESRTADIINCRQNTYVRFHWHDEDTSAFFELRITKNNLTGKYTLEITDFAVPGESDDVRSLWDSSIEALHRCGI